MLRAWLELKNRLLTLLGKQIRKGLLQTSVIRLRIKTQSANVPKIIQELFRDVLLDVEANWVTVPAPVSVLARAPCKPPFGLHVPQRQRAGVHALSKQCGHSMANLNDSQQFPADMVHLW